jgi:6-phosphofructokinase 1
MGAAATECISRKEFGVLVGLIQGEIATTPLANIVGKRKKLDPHLLQLAGVLAK